MYGDYTSVVETDPIVNDIIENYQITEYNKEFVGCQIKMTLGNAETESSSEEERVLIITIIDRQEDWVYSEKVLEINRDELHQEIFDAIYEYITDALDVLESEVFCDNGECTYDDKMGEENSKEFEEQVSTKFAKIKEEIIDNSYGNCDEYFDRIVYMLDLEEENNPKNK